VAIDHIPVTTLTDVSARIATLRSLDADTVTITLIPKEHINIRPDTNVPQIHFDQMNVMAHQHSAARNNTPSWSDPHNPHLSMME